MDRDLWAAVDARLDEVVAEDVALVEALRRAAAAGLPPINVSPAQGKLLALLVRMCGARRVLEIGTLAGYSTIWLAHALPPDGRVVTLEIDAAHAEVARHSLDAAAAGERVDVRLGAALDTLPSLRSEEPFDFVFIDADKVNSAAYLEWAVDLGHRGTVVVLDNVIRAGAVVDDTNNDDAVTGTRRALDLLATHERLDATAIQTVGVKGYDGFALAVVR